MERGVVVTDSEENASRELGMKAVCALVNQGTVQLGVHIL
jgi:hypothetical protein